jgi:hypothetical protein
MCLYLRSSSAISANSFSFSFNNDDRSPPSTDPDNSVCWRLEPPSGFCTKITEALLAALALDFPFADVFVFFTGGSSSSDNKLITSRTGWGLLGCGRGGTVLFMLKNDEDEDTDDFLVRTTVLSAGPLGFGFDFA